MRKYIEKDFMIYYMNIAFKEAKKAFKKNEIPVGAIIVKNNKIIAKAHNDRQKKHNVLGHAEINAILKAEKHIKDWRLDGCDMYVTLKPCQMCKDVIKECRISTVHYLLDSPVNYQNIANLKQTSDCELLKIDYKKLMENFFKELRQ